MDNTVKIFLVFGIIIMALYLYSNIVPCQTNNNDNNNNNNNEDDENNQIENFELPIQLNDIFKQRTRLLKEQVVDSNMLGSDITSTSTEIKRLKNKLKMMIEDMKNNGNETYMINTNGEVTKEVN
jgi:hypothetical protein